MKNFLSGNILFLRELKGLSLTEVSEKTSKGRTTINNWEKGVSEPSISDLIELSKFFQVPVDELIQENLSEKSPDYLKAILNRTEANIDNIEVVDTLFDVSRLLEELSNQINSVSTKIWNSAKALEAKSGKKQPTDHEIF